MSSNPNALLDPLPPALSGLGRAGWATRIHQEECDCGTSKVRVYRGAVAKTPKSRVAGFRHMAYLHTSHENDVPTLSLDVGH
jgi:hypothetical protein